MSTFEVKIQKLVILPHPNADALELAVVGGLEQTTEEHADNCRGCRNPEDEYGVHHAKTEIIGGFRAIVPKGVYQTGDYALYIPEAAVLPEALIEELGLAKMLHGSGKNRVKAIRLRGELSQGIVCRPASMLRLSHDAGKDFLWEYTFNNCMVKGECDFCAELLEQDWAELLGIVKWSPSLPVHLRGKIRQRGESRILPWMEIENIKKQMRVFEPGEMVVATEKIHGTHLMVTLDLDADGADGNPGEILVSSKGMGKQGWDLVEEDGNLYWRAVRKHKLEQFLRGLAHDGRMTTGRLAIYGEVYGTGVQDLDYAVFGDDMPGYVAFDIKRELDGNVGWLDAAWLYEVVSNTNDKWGTNVQTPPVIYSGPYNYELLCERAEGMSILGNNLHIREGIVVRPAYERMAGQGYTRVIAKFISQAYLLRKAGTEFE